MLAAMCCFSRPVKVVSSTAIFARRASPGRQLLAYKMDLEASEDLAMILPLPVPPGTPEDAVRFLDLSGYPTFFSDLDRAFPTELLYGRGARGFAPQSLSRSAPLAVHTVGDFEASFVPKVADFSRLDRRFRLDDNVWKKLPRYGDHGFAVFQLRGLGGGWFSWLRRGEKKRFHPMAFEFPTREAGHLFYPTVHIHDGEVHPEARFDHALYAQADAEALQGSTPEPGAVWEETPWIAGEPAGKHLRVEATKGLVSAEGWLFKKVLEGSMLNADRWVKLPA
jgi:hypothetical protein